MGHVGSSHPERAEGGDAGFERALSIDDAERYAATFKPSWEFDEAPFTASSSIPPAEMPALNAQGVSRTLPPAVNGSGHEEAFRSVPPHAPPPRTSVPAAPEDAVIVSAPDAAPVVSPTASALAASALSAATEPSGDALGMAPPPRVAAGLGLPSTPPRHAPSEPAPALAPSARPLPRNAPSTRPTYDSEPELPPRRRNAKTLVIGGAVLALAAGLAVYKASGSDEPTTLGGASNTAGTSASSPVTTPSIPAPPSIPPDDLAAALGSSHPGDGSHASPSAREVPKPASAPAAAAPPPAAPQHTSPAPHMVATHAIQRPAPPPPPKPAPPKPSGGIVRDVPF